MGIPRLISTLEPFADQTPIRNEDVFIDGPALAYHVLYICRRNGVRCPSYKLIGNTAVAWLDALSMCGLAVHGLYFDGFLPASKTPVRMERMIKTTSQMNQFYAMSPSGCATYHLIPDDDAKVVDLFSLDQPDAKQLLPPSFLVPATIEALKNCPRYRDAVIQVPGEADGFCARQVAAHWGTVITSDSDLLVHDLGELGRVVFFRDIHIAEQNASCLLYTPRDICQKLRIPPTEIRRLGYEVYRSYNTPVSQMALNCKKPVANEQEYNEFCQQYLHEDICPVPKLLDGTTLPIGRLDPRLSELALQFGLRQSEDDFVAKIFLPVLIENPMKSSAWEASTPIRQLGYSILSWLIPSRTSSVQEYRRVQAQQQKGRSVSILSNDVTHQEITDLLEQMKRTEETTKGVVPYWLFLSLTLDIAECERQGKRSHTFQTIKEYATASPLKQGSKISWDTVHFAYHIQASYYSFRMLQQILSIAPNAFPTVSAASIKQLQKRMGKFPSLGDFPDVRSIIHFLETSRETGVLELLGYSVNDESKDPKATTPPTKSSKKRKKSDAQHATGSNKTAKPAASRSENIFSLLENNEDN